VGNNVARWLLMIAVVIGTLFLMQFLLRNQPQRIADPIAQSVAFWAGISIDWFNMTKRVWSFWRYSAATGLAFAVIAALRIAVQTG